MELRHLEYFLAVADTRSFTRAARRLHVVQSGVSATVKALERELGAEPFVRGPAGVALTPAGGELRPHARATLDAARAAKDAVNTTRGAVRGTVTLGTLTSINIVDLPTLLADLHARHPEVRIQLRAASAGTTGLAQQLRDGDLDIAFLAFTSAPPPDLHARLVAEVPLLLVVPADHPLAQRDSVSLADLAGMSFVDGPPGYGNRTVVDNAFAAAGVGTDRRAGGRRHRNRRDLHPQWARYRLPELEDAGCQRRFGPGDRPGGRWRPDLAAVRRNVGDPSPQRGHLRPAVADRGSHLANSVVPNFGKDISEPARKIRVRLLGVTVTSRIRSSL